MQGKNGSYIEKTDLKNRYLGFLKLCFFDPQKKSKNHLKNDHKIQNFQNIQKTEYVL